MIGGYLLHCHYITLRKEDKMTKITDEKKIFKLKLYLPLYLQQKGIDIRKNFSCPDPGHGSPDVHPSCTYYQKDNICYCHKCKKTYDIFDLIGFDENINYMDSVKRCEELFSGPDINYQMALKNVSRNDINGNQIDRDEIKKREIYINECAAKINTTNYLKDRGLSDKTIRDFKLGYDRSKNSIVIPFIDSASNYFVTRSVLEKKYIKPKGEKCPIFNLRDLYNVDHQPVFITEGQLDCLSFKEIERYSIGLNGLGFNTLLEQIKNNQISVPLIIATDNDKAGNEVFDKLSLELIKLDVPYVRFKYPNDIKDPNEFLINQKDKFIESALSAIENALTVKDREKNKYIETSAGNYLNLFRKRIKSPLYKPISLCFEDLNYMLGGGLIGSSTVYIGASPSVGKTTFVMQLVENVAKKHNRDVLYFSLEMSKDQLISKSISRITYEISKDNKYASSNIDILKGYDYYLYDSKKINLIEKGFEIYKQYGDHIYIIDDCEPNIKNIIDRANEHIRITKSVPIIVIDYLQLLNNGKDDMQSIIKETVYALKQYSIKNDTIGIAITAFNRASAGKASSLESGRDSSNIEYGADYYFSLNFTDIEDHKEDVDLDELKAQDTRYITLKILKNRLGITGTKLEYEYIPRFNYFKEIHSNPNDSKKKKPREY